MKNFLLPVLFMVSLHCYAQCDPNVVFSNDSTHAVCIDTTGNVINIYANDIPDHAVGDWPSNNPVDGQDYEYHVCVYPMKASEPTSIYNAPDVGNNCRPQVEVGVGLNGVFYSGWGAMWFVDLSLYVI